MTARARAMKNLPPSMTPRENPSGTGAVACCPRTRRSVANDAHALLRWGGTFALFILFCAAMSGHSLKPLR